MFCTRGNLVAALSLSLTVVLVNSLCQFVVTFGLGLIATATTTIAVPIPTLEQLSKSQHLPTQWLLGLRTAFATVIALCLRSSLTDPEPHLFTMITYSGTRLPPKSVKFSGMVNIGVPVR